MNFPVEFHLFGLTITAHFIFESLAYFLGFRYYKNLRMNSKTVPIPMETNLWLIASCILGAALGAKLLNLLEINNWGNLSFYEFIFGGKTIVGGFIGGWIGVEIAKYFNGVKYSTGDNFVFPIIVGTCVGRIGCFLEGLEDGTFGIMTTLPIGIDFGDNVRRHPTQLYEIAYLMIIFAAIKFLPYSKFNNGVLFRLFMLLYFLFRFFVEFIKPHTNLAFGLSAIQIASALMFFYCCVIFIPKSKYYVFQKTSDV